ncbi:MAG TPA: D-2-hydroxyacid dehydrogenase [Polyangiaceae bacterium]|nr:D-2-hydroxyacid dehydrogenase [Polyangiaceae bacterium]
MSVPKITVLDGHTLNPGDLSWAPLAALGDVTLFERTPSELVVERARDAEIVITNKVVISGAAMAQLAALRYIGVTATGTNIVDTAAARQRQIVVSNVPSYGADSVAEHTLSLMLEAAKHLGAHTAAVRAGAWARQPDFSFSVGEIRLLAQRTLGIVGLGAIGRRVAELARAFKMSILAAGRRGGSIPDVEGVRWCELGELVERADFLSLHCPLSEQTQGLVDAALLARMRPQAVLINTSRGGLVDEAALAEALRAGRIAGAYLDVLSVEPPPLDHPLVGLPNCWITPHIAWASLEARTRLLEVSVENLRAFLAGKPRNVVT